MEFGTLDGILGCVAAGMGISLLPTAVVEHAPPAAQPAGLTLTRSGRAALGEEAALSCVACCALPVLIAAGVVGTGAGVVVSWLPALAVVLAVLAAGTWWPGRRRRSCSCAPKTAGEGG